MTCVPCRRHACAMRFSLPLTRTSALPSPPTALHRSRLSSAARARWSASFSRASSLSGSCPMTSRT
eukprot:3227062-Alexandrium_andersonii.AAC.1